MCQDLRQSISHTSFSHLTFKAYLRGWRCHDRPRSPPGDTVPERCDHLSDFTWRVTGRGRVCSVGTVIPKTDGTAVSPTPRPGQEERTASLQRERATSKRLQVVPVPETGHQTRGVNPCPSGGADRAWAEASLPWSGHCHRQAEPGDAVWHVDPFAEAASPASHSALLSGV